MVPCYTTIANPKGSLNTATLKLLLRTGPQPLAPSQGPIQQVQSWARAFRHNKNGKSDTGIDFRNGSLQRMYREPTLLNPTWRRLVFMGIRPEYAGLNDEVLPHVAAGRQLLSNQRSCKPKIAEV